MEKCAVVGCTNSSGYVVNQTVRLRAPKKAEKTETIELKISVCFDCGLALQTGAIDPKRAKALAAAR